MCKSIRANKNHPNSDLLKILEEPLIVIDRWTKQEHAIFAKAVEKYGKKYKLISDAVKTKTRR